MKPVWLVLLGLAIQSIQAALVPGGPDMFFFSGAGSSSTFSLIDSSGKNIKFRYSGVTPYLNNGMPPSLNNPPNFVLVVVSNGTTPGGGYIGVNADVLPYMVGGVYGLTVNFTTVDQDPPQIAHLDVQLTLPLQPAPSIQSVVNTASFQSVISPGEMVTVIGTFPGAPTLSAMYDDTASYPTTLANLTLTFNGVPAPLLYVSPGQINALVPTAVAGQKSVDVVVKQFSQSSPALTVPLLDTSPGIFTASQTGSGQAAISQLGADGKFTYNTVDNPAPKGAAFELFSTGAGIWNPPFQSDISFYYRLDLNSFKAQPVSLTIGGQPAKILYAGTVGYQEKWSLLQVNAVVPDGVGSGPQQLVLKIGQNDNSQQKVTIAIQ
jgi:uncharacterized protein (TIGR03437 family)